MTANLLFLLGMGTFGLLIVAFRETRQVKVVLAKTHARNHLPKIVSMLIITTQFSELLKVIDHVSITHLVGALLLLGVMIATKAGTEGELTHE